MSGASDPLLDAVRGIVERVAGQSRVPARVDESTRLADGFWLDSGDLLNVILECEREFGIAFDDTQDFGRGAFETLGTLAALVRAKRGKALP